MKVLARYYPQYISARPTPPPAPDDDLEYYYSDREGTTKHLRDYWQVVLKRLRYMVPIFCGTVALGFLITIFSPTLYTARSTLKIEPQSPSFTGVAEAPNNSGSDRYD
jgi:uncharacterized protein involved in exopolysaccharide biosynthesis